MIADFIANTLDVLRSGRLGASNDPIEVRRRRRQLTERVYHTPWTADHAEAYRRVAEIRNLELQKTLIELEALEDTSWGDLEDTLILQPV